MYIEFDLPEIPDFWPKLSGYWLKYFFIGSPSQNYQINALASTYMRLVGAALTEYNLGASNLRTVWSTHTSLQLGAMFRSIAHFESCVTDMHRAINAFRRLRRHKAMEPLSVALASEKPAFATDAVADQLRLMRDEIHHLEKMVTKGQIVEGQPIALKPDGPEVPHPTEEGQTIKTIDRLVIAGRHIRFADIAAWLQEMAATAGKLAQFEPDSSKGKSL